MCCSYPDIFLGLAVTVEPFNRDRITHTAHYTSGKNNPHTTQWQDVCSSAHVTVQLHTEWPVRNLSLVHNVLKSAQHRPVILVHGGREPMGRRDNFGIELLPTREAFAATIDALPSSEYYRVQVGSGVSKYDVPHDLNLLNKTSVSDLLDLATISSGVVGQCSFAIPMAEMFDKPLLIVWAERGLRSATAFIKAITPRKILHKPSSHYVVDDWPVNKIQEAARAVFKF